MKAAKGIVFKYGDNVDTDVIIPARYLNSSDPAELATHCMEDIDKDFIHKVKKGDIIVADKNFGCGSSREHAPIAINRPLPGSFTGMPSISDFPSLNARRPQRESRRVMRWRWILTRASSGTSPKELSLRGRPSRSSCRRSLRRKGW